MNDNNKDHAMVPMRDIGPLKIVNAEWNAEVMVPLATYEIPLWPSTGRGAKVTRAAGGIHTIIVDECMTRSVVVEGNSATEVVAIANDLNNKLNSIADVIATTSRFAKFKNLNIQIVGKLLYLRLAITSGDASGHNMATKAAEGVLNWILTQYQNLKYVSISANFCTDKKVSAANGLLGRGKYVIAEVTISKDLCAEYLRTTPKQIVDLNLKKNWMGSALAGGIRTANAHFANVLLAMYLATGQDAANIVEGSQGMVYAELTPNEDLYFSITAPNIIVGTIGNGKNLPFVLGNLQKLQCAAHDQPVGANSRRLAMAVGATILCAELSLLAAQTNQGELVRSHVSLERKNSYADN